MTTKYGIGDRVANANGIRFTVKSIRVTERGVEYELRFENEKHTTYYKEEELR